MVRIVADRLRYTTVQYNAGQSSPLNGKQYSHSSISRTGCDKPTTFVHSIGATYLRGGEELSVLCNDRHLAVQAPEMQLRQRNIVDHNSPALRSRQKYYIIIPWRVRQSDQSRSYNETPVIFFQASNICLSYCRKQCIEMCTRAWYLRALYTYCRTVFAVLYNATTSTQTYKLHCVPN